MEEARSSSLLGSTNFYLHMENRENHHERTSDEVFVNSLLQKYKEELADMITNPHYSFSSEEIALVTNFEVSQKIPRNHKWFHDLFVRVCHDFRLTPDEIDVLRNRFLEQ